MAYNSTIDKDTDDILIYGNTVKDGSGTDYVPLLDADGQLQVDVIASGLPTGASTLAEQQSQTTHLATIAGDTTAIETAVQLIDDTVYTDGAGTVTKGIAILGQDGTNPQAIKTDASGELQVDVLTMPTTTVTATDLDIRNLVNTDVVTAELSATDNAVLDAIAASVAAIDTDATTIIGHVDGIETLIGTTNSSLTTIDGRVDGLETSNSAIQTAVQLIDDTVQVLGTDTYTEAASKGITLGAVRRDANTTLVNTTNEFTPLQVNATGELKVAQIQALPAGTNNIGDVDILSIAAGDNNIGNVDIVSGTITTVTTLTGGGVAHDGIDSGNPLKIGGKASSTVPTAVAAADRTDAWFDLNGRQIVSMSAPTGTQTSVAGSASNVTLLAANVLRKGATIYNDSTAILYLRLAATATTSNFTVKLFADDYYEVPFGYYGIIDGIWASATGNARVTELT